MNKFLLSALAVLGLALSPPAVAQVPPGANLLQVLNSPEYRAAREQAVQATADLMEPGKPVADKWYRDVRLELVALLIMYGKLQVPGTKAAEAADPRLAQVKAELQAIVNRLP